MCRKSEDKIKTNSVPWKNKGFYPFIVGTLCCEKKGIKTLYDECASRAHFLKTSTAKKPCNPSEDEFQREKNRKLMIIRI